MALPILLRVLEQPDVNLQGMGGKSSDLAALFEEESGTDAHIKEAPVADTELGLSSRDPMCRLPEPPTPKATAWHKIHDLLVSPKMAVGP